LEVKSRAENGCSEDARKNVVANHNDEWVVIYLCLWYKFYEMFSLVEVVNEVGDTDTRGS
jgi:hypothetical protein